MSEMSEITQIVRLEFEGVELAMKVGSASLKTMQKVAKVLFGMLCMEKTKGKTTLREMMMKGGDMQVFQFEEKDMSKIRKLCKKYGILYTMVPKTDKGSSARELLFHSEAVPRVNLMLKKLNNPKNVMVKAMETFVNEMDPGQMRAYEDAIDKQQEKHRKQDDIDLSVSEKKTYDRGKRERELSEVADRIRQVNRQNDRTTGRIYEDDWKDISENRKNHKERQKMNIGTKNKTRQKVR